MKHIKLFEDFKNKKSIFDLTPDIIDYHLIEFEDSNSILIRDVYFRDDNMSYYKCLFRNILDFRLEPPRIYNTKRSILMKVEFIGYDYNTLQNNRKQYSTIFKKLIDRFNISVYFRTYHLQEQYITDSNYGNIIIEFLLQSKDDVVIQNESSDNNLDNLIIVDVQKSFRAYFSEMYLHELKKYSSKFKNVYQIWDNHFLGKDIDIDYLYDIKPDIPILDDLYQFPNQVDIIEKRYQYDVSVDFYKKILSKDQFDDIKKSELSNKLKSGDYFKTKKGTFLIYIGNNHNWFHLPIKLQNIFKKLSGEEVILVGGSDNECYLDIEVSAKVFGVKTKRDYRYIYSGVNCPI